MTVFHYFIFLTCLLVLNIAVLYSYFLISEEKNFNEIHNEDVKLSLKNAYLIQTATLLAGCLALYFFSNDKTWFSKINFLYFLALTVICGLTGKIEVHSKQGLIFGNIVELALITGFVFLLPERGWMEKYSYPAEIVRLSAGLIWFVVYKFFCALCDRFKGILVIQSLQTGFIALLLLYFSNINPLFLYITGTLFPVMLMLAPLYCIFHYDLPLSGSIKNTLCLMITGFIFFTVPIEAFGTGSLMFSYVLFELAVVFFRFSFSFLKKEKLFFCECLLEKTQSLDSLVNIVIRYNILIAGLAFASVYLNMSVQFILLTVIIYIKLYLTVTGGQTKGGITDLIKGAKETAQAGYKETVGTFSELKEMYAKKQKEKKDDSQK